MSFKSLRCGKFANYSEEKAFNYFEEKLRSIGGDACWRLMSNVMVRNKPDERNMEVDLIVIGSTGVIAIEVKH